MSVPDRAAAETSDVLLAVLERANDAVVILDQDHRIRHFNGAAEQIWGRSRGEVLGQAATTLGLADPDEDGRTELTIKRPDGGRPRAMESPI